MLFYVVYHAKSDHILALGSDRECAETLGVPVKQFRNFVSKAKMGLIVTRVVTVEDTETGVFVTYSGKRPPVSRGRRRRRKKMKVKLDAGAYMPERAYSHDAGYDLRAMSSDIIPAGESAVFNTGVHVQIPMGFCGLLVSKSGLNVKNGITSTGLIDAGYRGAIRVKLYNHGAADYVVTKGDKISQMVILPAASFDLEQVEELDETERGDKGFGSSGRR